MSHAPAGVENPIYDAVSEFPYFPVSPAPRVSPPATGRAPPQRRSRPRGWAWGRPWSGPPGKHRRRNRLNPAAMVVSSFLGYTGMGIGGTAVFCIFPVVANNAVTDVVVLLLLVLLLLLGLLILLLLLQLLCCCFYSVDLLLLYLLLLLQLYCCCFYHCCCCYCCCYYFILLHLLLKLMY